MLNRRGGIECDLTVTRLADDRFRLISGTAFGTHDLAWIHKQLGEHEHVRVRDVTGSLACLGLWGPRARDVLEPLDDRPVQRSLPIYERPRDHGRRLTLPGGQGHLRR